MINFMKLTLREIEFLRDECNPEMIEALLGGRQVGEADWTHYDQLLLLAAVHHLAVIRDDPAHTLDESKNMALDDLAEVIQEMFGTADDDAPKAEPESGSVELSMIQDEKEIS